MPRAVADIVADALISTGLESVDPLFGGTDETAREIVVALNDTAREIAEAHDWRAITRTHTILGDGTSNIISLPTDYVRMPQGARIWSTRLGGSYSPVTDLDTWLGLDTRLGSTLMNQYLITDDQIALAPAPGIGETVRYVYVSSLTIKNGTTYKSDFSDPNDVFLLSDRVLQLGLVYNLRKEQGLEAEHEGRKYMDALQRAISRDKGPRIITQASSYGFEDVPMAYPGTITG